MHKSLAFVRAEGVLFRPGVLQATAFMASQRAGLRERLSSFTQATLFRPVYTALGHRNPTLGTRLAHLPYRGMSADRIALLAGEYVQDVLLHRLFEEGLDLVQELRKQGHHVVLLFESISEIVTELRAHLPEVNHIVCNHLEYRGDCATGKLLPPIVGGHEGAQWATDYAHELSIGLQSCLAYASRGSDVLLLSKVGAPCAVNSDASLRSAARASLWPLLEFRS